MGAWTVCLIVGILGVLWFIGILKWKEGFVNAVDQSGFNSADRNAFEAARFEDHYADQTARFNRSDPGKGIFALDSVANGILDFRSKLTQAFRKSGLGTDSSPDLNMGDSLVIMDTDAETNRKFNFCKNMTFEEWARDTSDTCGWLHLPTAQSMAVCGVKAGPDPRIQVNGQAVTLDNGRKWFWRDIREARRAEEEKACKLVTACTAMDPAKNCAFNTRTGAMEWHDRSVAGPANPDLVTRPENCPVEYRWCADAQTDAARQPCLRELLLFEGASKDGWLYKNVGLTRDTTFTMALQAVYERAKTPTDRALGAELGGAFGTDLVALQDLRAKIAYLKRIADSSDPFLADLAQMLVYGQLLDGRVFLLENYFATAATAGAIVGNEDQKAVAVDILQREWRKAGCQAAGSGYPKYLVAGKSLVDLRAEYAGLHEQMLNSESPLLQKEAIQKCLGIPADPTWSATETGDFCNERGIEYFLYDGVGSTAILIGHLYSSSGLLTDDAKTVKAGEMKTILRSATVFPTVSYKARTMISTSNRIEMTPHPSWTAVQQQAYRLMVNKTVVQPNRVVFEAGRRNIFDIDYTGSREASWGAPRYSYIDMNLDMFQLFQSASKPFVNFNFKEGLLDSNRLVRLDSVAGLKTVQQDSETGIQQKDTGRVKIVPAIRSTMIHIISQRLWIPTDASTVVLFRLENAAYSEMCELRGTQIVYTVRNGFDPLREVAFEPTDTGVLRGKWVNIAMAFSRTAETLKIEAYVNQQIVATEKTIQIPNENFKRPLDVIVVNNDTFRGTMAWFHIYNRKDIRAEGFQNQGSGSGSGSGSASGILAQEASYDPQTASGFSGRRAAARIADFLIGSIKQPDLFYYTSTSAPAPAPASASASASAGSDPGPSSVSGCPFDPIQFSGAVNANYTPGVYYKQKFKGNLNSKVYEATSAKQCETEARKKSDQAYTFNSKEGKCYTYADLGSELTTEGDVDSFSAILSKKDDLTYKDLKQRTLDAIADYRAIRDFFKSSSNDLYDKVFQTRTGYGLYDRTMDTARAPGASVLTDFKGIPRIDEPRTDREINRDMDAVKLDAFINSTDCLNGIYEKYRSK